MDERNLGEVHVAPLPVRLWPGKIREPDIFFGGGSHLPGHPDGGPGEKFAEYAKAGVREFWVVDPEKRTVEVVALRGHVYEPSGYSG